MLEQGHVFLSRVANRWRDCGKVCYLKLQINFYTTEKWVEPGNEGNVTFMSVPDARDAIAERIKRKPIVIRGDN